MRFLFQYHPASTPINSHEFLCALLETAFIAAVHAYQRACIYLCSETDRQTKKQSLALVKILGSSEANYIGYMIL